MSDLSRTLASWTYENVPFPATETRVEWGHDSAKHQGYGQRGTDIETTGQKPRVITATIPLRNGLRWPGERLYPETYLKLREAFKTAAETVAKTVGAGLEAAKAPARRSSR